MQINESWNLFPARRTPRCPEIQQNNVTSIGVERNAFAIDVVDGELEVRSFCLCRCLRSLREHQSGDQRNQFHCGSLLGTSEGEKSREKPTSAEKIFDLLQ
jgi:hypothetical protein